MNSMNNTLTNLLPQDIWIDYISKYAFANLRLLNKEGYFLSNVKYHPLHSEEYRASINGSIFKTIKLGNILFLKNMINWNYFDANMITGDDSLLTWAVIYEQFDIIEFLVYNGADINLQDEAGWSCLNYAVSRDNVAILNFLIDMGGNIYQKDDEGLDIIDLSQYYAKKCLHFMQSKMIV